MRKNFIEDLLLYILGCLIYSFAVTSIITPNNISAGGFTGIATLVNYLYDFPIGLTLLLLNIPIIIIAFIKIGSEFILKTAVATFILSFTLDFSQKIFPKILLDNLLSSVFGGILMGMGLGIIFIRGATTGGVDIIGKLVNKRHPHITVGKVIFFADIIVILLATITYKMLESGLYSIIALFASSRIVDTVIYGFDKAKIAIVFTKKSNDICNFVINNMNRGISKIKAYGGYKGEENTMLICTLRRHEVSKLSNKIKELDPKAFVILTDASEIIGQGFKKI